MCAHRWRLSPIYHQNHSRWIQTINSFCAMLTLFSLSRDNPWNPTSRGIWPKPKIRLGTIRTAKQVSSGKKLDFQIMCNEFIVSCPLTSLPRGLVVTPNPSRGESSPMELNLRAPQGNASAERWSRTDTDRICGCFRQKGRGPWMQFNGSLSHPHPGRPTGETAFTRTTGQGSYSTKSKWLRIPDRTLAEEE